MSSSPTVTPSWFIFDIGNVLLRIDSSRLLRHVSANSKLSAEELMMLMEGEGGYRDLERGLFDFSQFHGFLVEKASYKGDLEVFRRVWADFFDGTVEGIEEVLERARQRYRVAFLSNSNEVHAERIPRDFPQLFTESDVFVFSHEHRSAKPDQVIFRKTLDILDARPEECIYVDDLPQNVAAAAACGLVSFQFIDSRRLVEELEGRGLL